MKTFWKKIVKYFRDLPDPNNPPMVCYVSASEISENDVPGLEKEYNVTICRIPEDAEHLGGGMCRMIV